MPEFAPIDRAFLEEPSARLGGFITLLILDFEEGRPALDLRPGYRPYSGETHPPRGARLPSATELLHRLEAEHRSGYWYRGQLRRRSISHVGRIRRLQDGPFPRPSDPIERAAVQAFAESCRQGAPISFWCESLLPACYRDRVVNNELDWRRECLGRLDSVGGLVRQVVTSGSDELRHAVASACLALLEASERHASEAPAVARVLNVPDAVAYLISLAQHYEWQSSMVDVTSSIGVALWFATHEWSTGHRVVDPAGRGVIYRFRDVNSLLRQVEGHLSNDLAREVVARTGTYGCADLSKLGVPAERARRQSGGAVFGLESLLVGLVLAGLVDVYEFSLQDDVLTSTVPRNKEELAPSDDPYAPLLLPRADADRSMLNDHELQTFLLGEGWSAGRVSDFLSLRRAGRA